MIVQGYSKPITERVIEGMKIRNVKIYTKVVVITRVLWIEISLF